MVLVSLALQHLTPKTGLHLSYFKWEERRCRNELECEQGGVGSASSASVSSKGRLGGRDSPRWKQAAMPRVQWRFLAGALGSNRSLLFQIILLNQYMNWISCDGLNREKCSHCVQIGDKRLPWIVRSSTILLQIRVLLSRVHVQKLILLDACCPYQTQEGWPFDKESPTTGGWDTTLCPEFAKEGVW